MFFEKKITSPIKAKPGYALQSFILRYAQYDKRIFATIPFS